MLCADDRRGIYTELTDKGWALYREAAPTHDTVLEQSLESAGEVPELAALVQFLHGTPGGGARRNATRSTAPA